MDCTFLYTAKYTKIREIEAMLARSAAFVIANALLCAPLAAHAELTAKASISGLQFVLSDLTPNDAETPSLTSPLELQSVGWESRASASITNFNWQQNSSWQQGVGILGDASASAVFGPSHAQAWLAGSGTPAGPYNITASGTLNETPSGDYKTTDFSSLNAQAGTNEYGGTNFLLSAHTSLTLVGQADLFISSTGATPNFFDPSNTYVSGKFSVGFVTPDANSIHVDSAAKELIMGYSEAPRTDSFNQAFSFTYANDTDHVTVVSLWANTSVYAMLPHLPASAVPEPGSQVLMALGLIGLLGLTRRH